MVICTDSLTKQLHISSKNRTPILFQIGEDFSYNDNEHIVTLWINGEKFSRTAFKKSEKSEQLVKYTKNRYIEKIKSIRAILDSHQNHDDVEIIFGNNGEWTVKGESLFGRYIPGIGNIS